MKAFTDLFRAVDRTTKTTGKLAALTAYFGEADAADAAWAVFFLSGERLKGLAKTADLRAWALDVTGVAPWLLERSHAAVGDLSETLALLVSTAVPAPRGGLPSLAPFVARYVAGLQGLPADAQRPLVVEAWERLDADGRLVYHKLLRGGFRIGVSKRLLTRALAETAGLDPAVVAHRLSGTWVPSAESFAALLSADATDAAPSQPYPFFLAHPLQEAPETLGDASDWRAEWKYDGIRAQLIRRAGEVFLWSRGEALITAQFPEIAAAALALPDGTVLDGEIVGWRDGLLPFADLQRRLNRKKVSAALQEEVPVALLVFDCLEDGGADVRAEPLDARVARMAAVVPGDAAPTLQVLAPLEAATWAVWAAQREEARARGVEGLMLKRRDSPYGVGRPRGPWWKWKVAPYTLDAVLLYARPGSGIRASLYTDYSFGLRDGKGAFVKFADAYSGLTKAEIREVDRWIRRHTVERFGPVRQVEPALVFELAFEGIRPSKRHKAGLAVRFPRIVRWRRDRAPGDINTLDDARALLPPDYR